MTLLNRAMGKLEPQFLNQALKAAIQMDGDVNVGNIVLSGPVDITEGIKFAEKGGKPHAKAMLMLIMAAQTGDGNILNQLCLKVANRTQQGAQEDLSLIHI